MPLKIVVVDFVHLKIQTTSRIQVNRLRNLPQNQLVILDKMLAFQGISYENAL